MGKRRRRSRHQRTPTGREYARRYLAPDERRLEAEYAKIEAELEEERRRQRRRFEQWLRFRTTGRYTRSPEERHRDWEVARSRSLGELEGAAQAEFERKLQEELDRDLAPYYDKVHRDAEVVARDNLGLDEALGRRDSAIVEQGPSGRDVGRPELSYEPTITAALARGGRTVEEARAAFARGPRTRERKALQEKLRPILRELIVDGVVRRGGRKWVPKAAVARFFGCSEKTIARLLG